MFWNTDHSSWIPLYIYFLQKFYLHIDFRIYLEFIVKQVRKSKIYIVTCIIAFFIQT